MATVVSFGLFADEGRPNPIGIGFLIFFAAVVALIAYALIVLFPRRATRRYRLAHFAQENGLSWFPTVPTPDLPRMIFSEGHSRGGHRRRPRAASPMGRGRQLHVQDRVGQERADPQVGVRTAATGHPAPHIVLDAVGNNGLFGASNLPRRSRAISA